MCGKYILVLVSSSTDMRSKVAILMMSYSQMLRTFGLLLTRWMLVLLFIIASDDDEDEVYDFKDVLDGDTLNL